MPPNHDSSTQVMNPLVGPTLTRRSSVHCLASAEPQMKKIRLDGSFHSDDISSIKRTTPGKSTCEAGTKQTAVAAPGKAEPSAQKTTAKPETQQSGENSKKPPAAPLPDAKPAVDRPKEDPKKPPAPDPSNKPTRFAHLKTKYHGELTYMLREFEKLERQLLGARKTEENAGSRERREKLHSFIIHLRETIQQIEAGVKDEPDSTVSQTEEEIAKTAETVQKLEEHILANLLPVKVRLKKQLAAQQGARHNPVGMPQHSAWNRKADASKGTFAEAAEKRRKEAEEAFIEPREPAAPVESSETQYGKPITKGGSSLTKKLHGRTLGNKEEAGGEKAKPEKETKRYYGGMALGSDQIDSSVTAASSVHKLIIRDAEIAKMKGNGASDQKQEKENIPQKDQSSQADKAPVSAAKPLTTDPKVDPEEQERRRRRRRRRKKRQQREQELRGLNQQTESETPKASKKSRQVKKQRGPRQVEYICALCNEVYSSTCDYNPWWALAQHECPKCEKTQVPRVDISAPANAIEYHPALLAHADDGGVAQAQQMQAEVEPVVSTPTVSPPDDTASLGSDVSSGLEDVSSDGEGSVDMDSDGDDSVMLTPSDRAENENFGAQYTGPKLEETDASRLIVLMAHASTCACQHRSQQQQDVCRSTRWMMLHVRDCPGTTSTYDICPFPWCRKVKHLLYHLVSCRDWKNCKICSNPGISKNLLRLRGLNEHRLIEHREALGQRRPAQRTAPVPKETTQKPDESAALKTATESAKPPRRASQSGGTQKRTATTTKAKPPPTSPVKSGQAPPALLVKEMKAIEGKSSQPHTPALKPEQATSAAVKVEPSSSS